MLRLLQIKNYALIESLELEFCRGLTVLTGETGAGKSIILDAIAMLTGSRAYTEAIRTGADSAWLAGVFDITGGDALQALLSEMGFDHDGRELVVAREIHRSGRNKCWINGRLATVASLKEIGSFLVEIQGQDEHQAVLDPQQHLEMLDAAGGEELNSLRRQMEAAYAKARTLAQERERLVLDEQARLRQVDLLQFQRDEIAAANLTAGEEVELAREREILRHGEKLREAVVSAYNLLYGGGTEAGSVLEGLGTSLSLIQHGQRYDERLGAILQMLEAANANIQQAAWELRDYADGLEADPQRLNQVEERLALIQRLERKYGEGTEAILAYGEKVSAELDELLNSEIRAAEIEKEMEKAILELSDLAGRLSAVRKAAADKLQDQVLRELPDLNLANARFQIQVSQTPSPEGIPYPHRDGEVRVQVTSRGADQVEFLFSANPGQDLRPLAKVASGGEASRLMLALKSVLAASDDVPTLVFDEVDTGIGGSTALAVGAKLAGLARHRQVLCVTHLAQVAGAADHHLAIYKEVSGGSTRVVVKPLDAEDRIEEIARMLAGDGDSEVSRQHARQLLAQRATS
ncbi:MAG: DNA repair protein RecN [Firmicutes bacterium]|nr:DNA repair protein RecN [Bacillota bacterium]